MDAWQSVRPSWRTLWAGIGPLCFPTNLKEPSYYAAEYKVPAATGGLVIGMLWLWVPGLFVLPAVTFAMGVLGALVFIFVNSSGLRAVAWGVAKKDRRLPQSLTIAPYMGERYGSAVQHSYTGMALLVQVYAPVLHLSTGVTLLGATLKDSVVSIEEIALQLGLGENLLISCLLGLTALTFAAWKGINWTHVLNLLKVPIIFVLAAIVIGLIGTIGFSGLYSGLWGVRGHFKIDAIFAQFAISYAISNWGAALIDPQLYQGAASVVLEERPRAFSIANRVLVTLLILVAIVGMAAANSVVPIDVGSDQRLAAFQAIHQLLPKSLEIAFVVCVVITVVAVTANAFFTFGTIVVHDVCRGAIKLSLRGWQERAVAILSMVVVCCFSMCSASFPLSFLGLVLLFGAFRAPFLPVTLYAFATEKGTLMGKQLGVLLPLWAGLLVSIGCIVRGVLEHWPMITTPVQIHIATEAGIWAIATTCATWLLIAPWEKRKQK